MQLSLVKGFSGLMEGTQVCGGDEDEPLAAGAVAISGTCGAGVGMDESDKAGDAAGLKGAGGVDEDGGAEEEGATVTAVHCESCVGRSV
jgi:hypothetical protein